MLDTVAPLARDLAGLEQDALRDLGDDTLLAHLSALEDLKDAACAVQARLTVALDASLRRAAAARGVPARQQGRETASYVGLARRESPAKAGSWAWRRCWWPSCPRPWPPWRRAAPTSGGPPCSPARPARCR